MNVSHGIIPPGGTIIAYRNYHVGPCGHIPSYFIHDFWAFVDYGNLINEANENNNGSSVYSACNG